MNRISRSILFTLGWMVVMLAGPSSDASAAALRHAKNFVLPRAETVHDDLYAAGTVIDIQGTVDGDLIVVGQTVTIGGNVTGDVIAAARDVTISGNVGGTVRAAGNAVTIDGTVEHDILSGSRTLVVGPNASVGRDVLAGAASTSLGGRIGRDVRTGSESATFSGSVGGTVYVRAKEIGLNDGAVLEKDLFYTSENEIVKSSGAVVRGRVERRVAEEHGRKGGFGGPVIGWLRGLVGLLILGTLFFLLTGAGKSSLEALGHGPWASLGIGALLAFGVPCAALFLFVMGLVFGGWWIALGALVLYFFALALGYVVTATHLGRWILSKLGNAGAGIVWALLLGLAVLGLVTAVPFLGGLVALFAVCLGLGAIAIAWYRSRRGSWPGSSSTAF
jgi:cytoskeletal protein CcmA (bactofilin family)